MLVLKVRRPSSIFPVVSQTGDFFDRGRQIFAVLLDSHVLSCDAAADTVIALPASSWMVDSHIEIRLWSGRQMYQLYRSRHRGRFFVALMIAMVEIFERLW